MQATIIDFGLSRLYSDHHRVVFASLPDEAYEGVGEQWDVYRAIREEMQEDWEGYHPITNVMVGAHVAIRRPMLTLSGCATSFDT